MYEYEYDTHTIEHNKHAAGAGANDLTGREYLSSKNAHTLCSSVCVLIMILVRMDAQSHRTVIPSDLLLRGALPDLQHLEIVGTTENSAQWFKNDYH